MRLASLAATAALSVAATAALAGTAQADPDPDLVDADVQDNPITVPIVVTDSLNGNHVLDGGVLSPIVPVGGVAGVDH